MLGRGTTEILLAEGWLRDAYTDHIETMSYGECIANEATWEEGETNEGTRVE